MIVASPAQVLLHPSLGEVIVVGPADYPRLACVKHISRVHFPGSYPELAVGWNQTVATTPPEMGRLAPVRYII